MTFNVGDECKLRLAYKVSVDGVEVCAPPEMLVEAHTGWDANGSTVIE